MQPKYVFGIESNQMYYRIRHTTRFRYSAPINESIMEVRIQPRSDGNQYCLDFQLHTSPRSHIMNYRGEFGNRVHHFDIPNSHNQLTITAQALVDVIAPPQLPEKLTSRAWDELDTLTSSGEYWDSLMPSHFADPTELLYELARELDVQRRDDPLTVLRDLNSAIYHTFEYSPKTTRVDSPIDDALSQRKGVCQDYAHIMITLAATCKYLVATSAATCIAARDVPPVKPHMPGSRHIYLTSAGLALTPPTIPSSMSDTCVLPLAATMPTYP